MEAAAVTVAIARARVKRALGQLRKTAAGLAEDLELEVLGELHLEEGEPLERVLELVRLARRGRRGAVDVVVVSSTSVHGRGRGAQPEAMRAAAHPHHGPPGPGRRTNEPHQGPRG